jgi:ketosteroid isomerase-like protein
MPARDVMTAYLSAARAKDWEAAFGLFADDLVIHIPGRSPFAGDHRGKQAAIDYISAIRERYGDAGIELDIVDMLAGEERFMLLVRERFQDDDGRTITIRRANVYRVAGGRIAEISIYEADQYVVDEELAAAVSGRCA